MGEEEREKFGKKATDEPDVEAHKFGKKANDEPGDEAEDDEPDVEAHQLRQEVGSRSSEGPGRQRRPGLWCSVGRPGLLPSVLRAWARDVSGA